jgi:hypothetical protein
VRLLRGQLVAAEMVKSNTEFKRDTRSSKAERDVTFISSIHHFGPFILLCYGMIRWCIIVITLS